MRPARSVAAARSRPVALVVAAALVGSTRRRVRPRSTSSTRSSRWRSSSRSTSSSATRACCPSATSASSPSAPGRRACSRSRRRRSPRPCRTSSASSATRPSGISRRSSIAAAVGGVFALLVGLPLMRLSGLAAGIATFAVLEITNNVLRYYEKIGPGLNTFSSVPETTDLAQAAVGALLAIAAAFAYQRSRLRAPAPRDARGPVRGPGRRRLDPPATARRVRALGRARRASRAASMSTCSRSTPTRSISISRSSPWRCS